VGYPIFNLLQRIHKKAFVFQVYSKKWSVVTVSGSSGREDIGKSVANCKSNEVVTVETGKNRYRFKDVSD
jgi:hypothetical protein